MKTYEEALTIWFQRYCFKRETESMARPYPYHWRTPDVDWNGAIELDFKFDEGGAYSTMTWDPGYARFSIKYWGTDGHSHTMEVLAADAEPEQVPRLMQELFAIGFED